MAVGSTDVHVSYYSETDDRVLYAKRSSAGWTKSNVSPSKNYDYTTKLVLDNAGAPHIMTRAGFIHPNGVWYNIAYYTLNGTTWSGTSVTRDTLGDAFSFRLDGNGSPILHVQDELMVKEATLTGTTWNKTVLTTALPSQKLKDMRTDSTGAIHIVYSDMSNSVKYSRFSNAQWSTPQSFATNNSDAFAKIQVDAQNRPRVFFWGNGAAQLATFNGVGWDLATVDSTRAAMQGALAIDSQSRTHVVYVTDFDVRYRLMP